RRAFKPLQTPPFRTRQPGTLPLVTFSLPDPFAQGLRSGPDLARHRDDRRPLPTRAPPGAQRPSAPLVLLLPVHTWLLCSYSHPLKFLSLWESRGNSIL